jgi:hypothetical protein
LLFDHGSGSLAAPGCRTGGQGLRIKVSGFPWFLWRTVYLLKLPGWPEGESALDWTGSLLPRDFVQLGVHRSEGSKSRQSEGVKSHSTEMGDEGELPTPYHFKSNVETSGLSGIQRPRSFRTSGAALPSGSSSR